MGFDLISLGNNIEEVRTRIRLAALRRGRNPADVTLIAVTKTVSKEIAQAAWECGISHFGENRTQDLKAKYDAMPQANWHMIGRLQTNKVKDVVGRACLVHSLDRWALAEELNRRGQIEKVLIPVLIQVNIAGEEQKTGLAPHDTAVFMESLGQLKWLTVQGLMTMAPLSDNAEDSRPIFKELTYLKDKLAVNSYPWVDLKYLSMGMSQDYEVAVEEGANLVRVGSAIFEGLTPDN